jgi:hypothetical protein
MPRNGITMRFSARAEGEGFEPSRDETAPNGFRDRIEHVDLQGIYLRCASRCASARRIAAVNAQTSTALPTGVRPAPPALITLAGTND